MIESQGYITKHCLRRKVIAFQILAYTANSLGEGEVGEAGFLPFLVAPLRVILKARRPTYHIQGEPRDKDRKVHSLFVQLAESRWRAQSVVKTLVEDSKMSLDMSLS